MKNPVSCTSAARGVADAMVTGVPDGATAYTAAPAIAIPDVVSRAIREIMVSLPAAVFQAETLQQGAVPANPEGYPHSWVIVRESV
jgi:hypothetical protein